MEITTEDQSPVAHIRRDENGSPVFHDLQDHLRKTAAMAAEFAKPFGSDDWARIAGVWHDLGKYQPAFQQYIRRANDLDAHIEGNATGPKDHAIIGALHAVERMGGTGRVLAYLIAGHHAGLADFEPTQTGDKALKPKLYRAVQEGRLDFLKHAELPEGLLHSATPQSQPPGKDRQDLEKGLHLWLRLLFSCLTDADFLDTEAFMRPDRPELRAGFPRLESLRGQLDRHLDALSARAEATPVNRIRNQVLRACREQAKQPRGVFSLTVPTGGGKTLSSLAFGLDHAIAHGMARVIYVIPYTSIIEQTADVFRKAFDELQDAVVEHHSSAEADPGQEDRNTRLACENWDAPIIVTTSVQFFESLFAARTSRCRKLHNIVNSVVILDEAQLIPPEFRQVILDSLKRLVRDYGVSLVICTATQPELGSVDTFQLKYEGLPTPVELAPDPDRLHQGLKRVRVELPQDLNQATDWDQLAQELRQHPSFLCIVNKRQDCRELHARMPKGTYHLSALMCGQHRADVIALIRADLAAKRPTRVVSTQLVEAGVDLDFPVVYRALAGIDSIAQAAGRCNREGLLEEGQVKVFIPPSKNFGLIARAEEATRELLHGFEGDILHPRLFRDFFRLFYSRIPPDKADIRRLLTAEGTSIQFRSAAERFRLIDDGYQETVFVTYGDKGMEWVEQLRRTGPERWLMRKLQRYAVAITQNDQQRLLRDGFIEEPYPGVFVQALPELYDAEIGLILEPRRDVRGLVC
ncbi:MAG: CRISPR-associated helicase Cas3' [Gammaproteobacteria bacterium]|nr:CRISPR-associated helicase Cas3' [Gammaproteobacteria bacterium]MBU1655676.1 CRISPR-associated helicase Cas3' [Gammaproteobacteria bacterium]MBU1962361.1 CRISPR-associated helicase Cas3' [Gammaproteobacteria bacterium]